MPERTISPEKVCFIVMRARGIAAKEAGPGLGEGSNPSDQGIDDEAADLDVLDASLPASHRGRAARRDRVLE